FGLCWLYVLYEALNLPDTLSLRTVNPSNTSYMELYESKHKDLKIKNIFVAYDKISPYLKEAVIASEDDQFFEHKGFSWEAIKKAAIYDWKKKKFARGASTITQQLARNLYLTPSKNPARKLKELLIALKLERELSKQRILELYLNVVEWGPGIFGCEAAANHYFSKRCSALSLSESAYLASILPSPRRLGKKAPSLTPRAERILNRID
ncbi:MAG: monofunctional biosynthetic peptidoglycan transglycosylase, partial [Deltaproteobacteria bacterium]|nr:monofunctional biosynthetic peptidoglycan transglycosylase [Deltaproteobacteria bacterium]